MVFLHRFSAKTTSQELFTKLLSEKKTGVINTLHQQYPTLRWVFPYPILHAGESKARVNHWEHLTTKDLIELELRDNGLPYVTQIVLCEAKLIGSLDNVIVGGQGETAVAAHAALNRFPEILSSVKNTPEGSQNFIRQTYPGTWIKAGQFKLAGFVGMHAAEDEATQDQRTWLLVSKWSDKNSI